MTPVFVHIPKTGGASILQLCLHHGIRVIDHDLRKPGYVSLAKYKSEHPDIHSFAVVRNPWDRVVSSYHYLSSGGITHGDMEDANRFVKIFPDFRSFVMNGFETPDILQQIHFRPQYLWISDNNKLIADMVGRFEKLDLHYTRWCKLASLSQQPLPHVNKSTHKPYKQYYDAETINIIRQVYYADIELFNYKF